ncbi:hypothetical protein [Streptomyces sp. NBC_01635]|uniref:hypothetical protein n=1 Tax=Streptomyces sp. NBC_01635 TaxID=2975904 RepID=UPI00386D7FD9
MRLTTIRITRDRTAGTRIDKKHLTLLPHPHVGALIASAPDWTQHAATHRGERLPLHAATTTEPLLTPCGVISVGPHCPTRIEELDQQRPAVPSLTITRPHATAGAQAAGVTAEPHFHDLRHTGNTPASTAGAGTRELMTRMGHSSSRAALIHQHMTSDRDRAIADRLGAMIRGGGGVAAGSSGEGAERA